MLKENKGKVILSSVIILLPIIFGLIMWDALPNSMTTHWAAEGNQDGFGGKAFAVFGLPLILLLCHLICLYITSQDKKQKAQNKKALGIIFWILPIISLLISAMVYSAALGKEIGFGLISPWMFGILFIVIGNYLPKTRQNNTLGIKISWTVNNEENWNKTHRLAGRVWVIGGFIMLLSAFLPASAMIWVLVCTVLAMLIIPVAYSCSIYKKHKKEGIEYAAAPKSKSEKTAAAITAVIVPVIIIAAALLLLTGNIEVDCGDTALELHADYWSDLKVDYSEIDSVSYIEDLSIGARSYGFASARLSMGIYQNEDFGSYTLYAYKGAEGYVVISSGDKTLVIGMKEPDETQRIYDTVLKMSGK